LLQELIERRWFKGAKHLDALGQQFPAVIISLYGDMQLAMSRTVDTPNFSFIAPAADFGPKAPNIASRWSSSPTGKPANRVAVSAKTP
jgi:hypothetical protein